MYYNIDDPQKHFARWKNLLLDNVSMGPSCLWMSGKWDIGYSLFLILETRWRKKDCLTA